MEECLLEDDKESVASETHTLPEATALEDVQNNWKESKREVLSEGGQSADHANNSEHADLHVDHDDDTPENRDGRQPLED